jgi:ABC-type lipoprotein export system ATPase subunit
MGLQTELPDMLAYSRQRRKKQGEEWTARRKSGTSGTFAIDAVQIELIDIAFHHTSPGASFFRKEAFRKGVAYDDKNEIPFWSLSGYSMAFEQGKIHGFIGKSGHGKGTLMKLLGNDVHCTNGQIFIPPHLRVIRAVSDPVFFNETLVYNLRFGLPASRAETDGSLERIKKILVMLGIDEADSDRGQSSIHDYVTKGKPEFEAKPSWDEKLSTSQKARLGIARAVIANPSMLVLESPVEHLHDDIAHKIVDVIVEYVEKKGVALKSTSSLAARRPRTVFVSTSRPKML